MISGASTSIAGTGIKPLNRFIKSGETMSENDDQKPRLVRRERVHDGWNKLDIATIADGQGEHPREIIDHGDVAAVLPVDRQRRTVLLARQWRAPLLAREADPYVLEVCAGIIDPGETPAETAIREAQEELGVRLSAVEPVAEILSSPGTMMEVVHLFLANYTQADRVSDGGGLDHEGETIEVIEMGFDDFFAFVRDDQPVDAKTLILAQHLLLGKRGGD